LSIVETVEEQGYLLEVVIALDFAPSPGKPLPAMADIRLKVTGAGELYQVGLGEAAMDADKELALDPTTGKPFNLIGNDIYQFLLFSMSNTQTIEGGRWMLFKVRFPPGDSGGSPPSGTQPAVIELLKRDEIFAPPSADMMLWPADFGSPVVVWPEVTE